MKISFSTQPKVLPFLFFTEMWERFGFYVVQGLLVLYITHSFGFTDSQAYTLAGLFAGLAYISPFFGGMLADKKLGFQTSILWGGLFLIIGYTLLAVSFVRMLFYPALAIIIIGNGLFKPNVSGLLGLQYDNNSMEREVGFTIFYVGINIGAALSGLSGYVRDSFGWPITFLLATFGMTLGLIIFLRGTGHLRFSLPYKHSFLFNITLFFGSLVVIGVLSFLLHIESLANWLLPIAGVFLLIFLTLLTLREKGEQRQRLLILNTLIISSIIFWMLFLQLFVSANLFVDRLVDKHILGIPLTTTAFYASEGVFIILLGPLFAFLWQVLTLYHKNPSPLTKFILGILFTGLGFVVLGTSTLFPNEVGLIPAYWVFLAYFLITIGELLLSPIGLSAITLLAPSWLIGRMMGVWFVATGFGGLFAGMIAKLASIPEEIQSTLQKLIIYKHAFFLYAAIAFFVGIILFFMQICLQKVLSTRHV